MKRAIVVIGEGYIEYGFDAEEIEVSIDHVHAMLSFPPSRSVGQVVGRDYQEYYRKNIVSQVS